MEKLKTLKKEIEKMSKYHQIEILKLCNNDINVLVNENNNGSFINLTEQNKDFINKLNDYVSYVIEQKKELELVEDEKTKLQNNFFDKHSTSIDNKVVDEFNQIKLNEVKLNKDKNQELYNE